MSGRTSAIILGYFSIDFSETSLRCELVVSVWTLGGLLALESEWLFKTEIFPGFPRIPGVRLGQCVATFLNAEEMLVTCSKFCAF